MKIGKFGTGTIMIDKDFHRSPDFYLHLYMSIQLTPKEKAIIRDTEEQGAQEEQARGGGKNPARKMLAGWLTLIGFFVLLFLFASLILAITN